MGVHLLLLLGLLLLVHVSNAQFVVFDVESVFFANEEQPIGTPLVDINVLYFDFSFEEFTEQYGSYSFVSGYDEEVFDIGASDGIVRFAVVLDIDQPNPKIDYSFKVNFTASDGFSSTKDFTVFLQDINDNTPAFDHTQYLVTLPENSGVGFEVLKVVASDPDQVATEQLIDEETETVIGINYTISNGRVLYKIQSGNDDNQFAIDTDTGNITVAAGSSIDFDEKDFYNLTICAQDGGGLKNTTLVLITISDSNDNAPVILYPDNFTIELLEDTPPGLIIVDYINATDDDHGNNSEIYFAIVGGDVTNSFTVDEVTGMVNLTGELDREAQNPLKLMIAAIDKGLPPLQDVLTVTIDLGDVNDEAPVFQESIYVFEIAEGPKIGTVVGTVHAIDDDEGGGGTVSYHLMDQSPFFSIDNTSGVISAITDLLDRETQSYYILTVIAIDNPLNQSLALSASVVVNVTLLDENDNSPQWSQTLYSAGILDTESPGFILTTLLATDNDIGTNGQVRYEFFNTDDSTFFIDIDSGAVTLEETLDFSLRSVYTYTVRAYDGAVVPKDSYTELNITVHTPNVKTPVFKITAQNLTLSEDVGVGVVVLNVTATDKDPGLIGLVRYRISADSYFDGSGSFGVTEDTGGVFVSERLDYDYK